MKIKLLAANLFEKLFVHPEGELKEIVFSEKDHFPHKQFPVEWWYFTGFLSKTEFLHNNLSKESSAENNLNWQYAFEVTFFRAKRPFESRMLHVALYKLDAGFKAQFLYGELLHHAYTESAV